MPYKFGKISLANLEGTHPDLQKVMYRAIELSTVDFRITEGLRPLARQKELFAAKATKTMNSRHLTGHAVDIAALEGGKISWKWVLYLKISQAVLKAAKELQIPVVWGGIWKTLKDGPHFELDRKFYP